MSKYENRILNCRRYIQDRLKAVIIEKALQEKIEYVFENNIQNEKLQIINTIRGSLSLCLHLLIDNAANALRSSLELKTKESLYLKVILSITSSELRIDVIDNGEKIPDEIRNKIFELNISTKPINGGYGLWRAKYICENEIGATLTLLPDEWDEKRFRIAFPVVVGSKNAIVVDDDPAWRGILERWLTSTGVIVNSAANHAEAVKLLSTLEDVSYVFLDISLDDFYTNVDGLSLVKESINKLPNAKNIILTAYPDRAKNYMGDVAVVLSKMDSEISDEDGFFNVLEQHGIYIR